MDRPILLITCGPLGSGKSRLPSYTQDYLKLNNTLSNKSKTNYLLIDDYVCENKNFKKEIDKLIKKYNIKSYKDLNKDIIEKFNQVYFKIRFEEEKCVDEKNFTCGQYLNYMFSKSLSEKKNVVFETNGTYFCSWIFDYYGKYLKKNNYQIIMSWNVVPRNILIRRINNRSRYNLEKYLDKEREIPPRIPLLDKEEYLENIKDIINVFEGVCHKPKYKSYNLRLLVFDNENLKHRIIYDNQKRGKKAGMKAISKYLLVRD
jgi:hypothetical protein